MKLPQFRPALRRGEQDEHVSVMPPWTIWVGACVVLLVGTVSGWALLTTFGGGSMQDKVRLEILKLTGSIVLGTGGGVALLLAARRQRATEVDLAQKKHDATERRVTELYTSAAAQLGSDKAAVRLAGLYALERLAQYYSDHRPTIVDVICAYLRMPYTPPSEDNLSARTGGGSQSRGLRRPNRGVMSPSPIRTVTTIASTFNGALEPGEEQRQEFQVRMAAQRLLIAHLRPEPDEHNTPTNQKFWEGVELDLTGAVLTDWDMSYCQVDRAIFENTEFHGTAEFAFATFEGPAGFGGSTFKGCATLKRATFKGNADFARVTFEDNARFENATFKDRAGFGDATFKDLAGFEAVTFKDPADFRVATFKDHAAFGGATFHGTAEFGYATFEGDSGFGDATFKGGAGFEGSTFKDRATLKRATFKGNTDFARVTFKDNAWFENATFYGTAEFGYATLEGVAGFGRVTFKHRVNFERTTFHRGIDLASARAKIDMRHAWPGGWVLREDTHHPETTEVWGTLVSEDDDLASDDTVG